MEKEIIGVRKSSKTKRLAKLGLVCLMFGISNAMVKGDIIVPTLDTSFETEDGRKNLKEIYNKAVDVVYYGLDLTYDVAGSIKNSAIESMAEKEIKTENKALAFIQNAIKEKCCEIIDNADELKIGSSVIIDNDAMVYETVYNCMEDVNGIVAYQTETNEKIIRGAAVLYNGEVVDTTSNSQFRRLVNTGGEIVSYLLDDANVGWYVNEAWYPIEDVANYEEENIAKAKTR